MRRFLGVLQLLSIVVPAAQFGVQEILDFLALPRFIMHGTFRGDSWDEQRMVYLWFARPYCSTEMYTQPYFNNMTAMIVVETNPRCAPDNFTKAVIRLDGIVVEGQHCDGDVLMFQQLDGQLRVRGLPYHRMSDFHIYLQVLCKTVCTNLTAKLEAEGRINPMIATPMHCHHAGLPNKSWIYNRGRFLSGDEHMGHRSHLTSSEQMNNNSPPRGGLFTYYGSLPLYAYYIIGGLMFIFLSVSMMAIIFSSEPAVQEQNPNFARVSSTDLPGMSA